MKNRKGIFRILSLSFAAALTASCGGTNLLKDLSNKESDEAIYLDALKLTDQGRYTEALAKFAELNPSFAAEPEKRRALAGAYAGQCGQDILAQSQSLSSGSGAPFATFMSMFTNLEVTPTSCYLAQTTIENTFGNLSSARESSDNLFMAILGMSKIGSFLRNAADQDMDGAIDGNTAGVCGGTDTDLVPDGIPGPFDACHADCISDNDVKQVGTGLGLVIDNFTAISASFGGSSSVGAISDMQEACALIPGNPCAITDPNNAGYDATAIKVIRSMIKSQSFGIQDCTLDPLVLCCP